MDIPKVLSYEEFDNLKSTVEAATGYKCYEQQPGNQTVWYGTADMFDRFCELVNDKLQTGSIAIILDGPTKKWSAFTKQWY